ncbi:hypothetical protein J1N35_007339 [Gossypium stocksii]|uniref:RNase H type-1 domain-containing protein n=1 Tax=Gossypium stocksii TaxID=47602 RepID=A0A9D3W6I6_9ROSI|nr:hypothetical protein J1N35_007339 [Gossypium stocksii]
MTPYEGYGMEDRGWRLMGSATCHRCHNGAESREHVFREFPIAKETWAKLGSNWTIQEGNTDFKDWLNNIFESNSLNQCKVIACALWVLWNIRNIFIHEGEVKFGSQTVDFVRNYIKELDGLSTCLPFISREANKVAHLIAKEGLQKRETTYLLNMVPTGAEEALIEDRQWTDSSRG